MLHAQILTTILDQSDTPAPSVAETATATRDGIWQLTQNLETLLVAVRDLGPQLGEPKRANAVQSVRSALKLAKKVELQLEGAHEWMRRVDRRHQRLRADLAKARWLSLTDSLTGLPNRRAFMARLHEEAGRAARYGTSLVLAIVDLDHFKRVNDSYGHAAGDEALRTYAREVLAKFRHHDLVARYGGEEFAILLPNTDVAGARRALTQAQHRVKSCVFAAGHDEVPLPGFSAGLAAYEKNETAPNFVARADKALYIAKRLGRQRVHVSVTQD